jgi:DNA-3-methyladenine glycosylase I
MGRGDVSRHLPAARLQLRSPHRCPAQSAGVRARRDLPRHGRGRDGDGGGGRELKRCWETTDPQYNAYHDEEWGRPVTTEEGVYERLCLEGFQSGLSWITILRKREAFRAAFEGFDPDRVARFDERDVERLLGDASIVRHRGKIEATIANARATVELRAAGTPLHELFWSHRPESHEPSRSLGEIPSSTQESAALSKSLRRAGFRFVGPTTAYAAMQACGVVNDHVADCWVRDSVEAAQQAWHPS